MHATCSPSTRTSSTPTASGRTRIVRRDAACVRSQMVTGRGRAIREPEQRICRTPGHSNHSSAATYRRRRAIVGTILAVLVAVSIVTAHDVLAGSGGEPASAAVSRPAHARGTVTAQPGDTLWSIAQDRHGAVPISRYVDAMVDLNGGASIQAGQSVQLP